MISLERCDYEFAREVLRRAVWRLRQRGGCILWAAEACGDVSGLLSPFPYFGGKRSVAPDVWGRLGCLRQRRINSRLAFRRFSGSRVAIEVVQ